MTNEEHIEDRYFRLLTDFIGLKGQEDLLGQFHDTPFVWVIPNDVNRAEDGRELRIELLHRLDATDHEIALIDDDDVSVLEVLAALAQRASFQTDTSILSWFETFLFNLELESLPEATQSFIVDDTLADWMSRDIEYDGTGGLFPLKDPPIDQRKVEIWYQMSAYIIEFLESKGFFT